MAATHPIAPGTPLLTSAAATCAAGLGAVVGLSLAASASARVGPLYPLKAGAIFVVIAAVALVFVRRHHPFARFGPANGTTTARAAIVALVAALLGEPADPALATAAVGAVIVFSALDGADGWLARRTRMASSFGARFDMEVDALLILALAMLVWSYGQAGAWIVTAGLMRYAFVACGRALPWMERPLPPSRRRQAVCVVQVGGLGIAMSPTIAPPASAIVAAIALGALAWSFLIDVRWLRRHAGDAPAEALIGVTVG